MGLCTVCLRSTHIQEQNGRPWCSWCGDYADRYAPRMPGTLDIACTVQIEHDSLHQNCLTLNGDVFGAWSWPSAKVEVSNQSPNSVILRYPTTPCACLELVVRDCRGERLSRQAAPSRGHHAQGSAAPLQTEIPPGQRLLVQIDPMADITPDATRTGEYSVQALVRDEGWQAVSEPVKFRVTAMQWLPTANRAEPTAAPDRDHCTP
jgi:hypothetical protein